MAPRTVTSISFYLLPSRCTTGLPGANEGALTRTVSPNNRLWTPGNIITGLTAFSLERNQSLQIRSPLSLSPSLHHRGNAEQGGRGEGEKGLIRMGLPF